MQGGIRHPVHISSIKLSKNLGISQQSASRYLIQLVDEGYLDRRLAQGGQVVTILEKGIMILRKEFSEYSLMFGTKREIEMKGTLETGLGAIDLQKVVAFVRPKVCCSYQSTAVVGV